MFRLVRDRYVRMIIGTMIVIQSINARLCRPVKAAATSRLKVATAVLEPRPDEPGPDLQGPRARFLSVKRRPTAFDITSDGRLSAEHK